MPKINLDDEDAVRKLNGYLRMLEPVAIESKFVYDTSSLPYEVKRIMAGELRIWYSTLWDIHVGGYDDDCSLVNPDRGYGYLIESLGATILQADRPAYLIDYLKHKSRVMDCRRDWTYSQSGNEFQAPFVPHLQVEKCFLKSKKNPQANENGVIITSYLAAVIDGAAAKSTFTCEGRKIDRSAMKLALEVIRNSPKDIDTADAIRRITERIYNFYVQYNLSDELKAELDKRFTANGVIYNYARNEVWQAGDCQCIVDNLYSPNEEEIDAIMADVRAVVNEVALLGRTTMKNLESHDPGRKFIYPFLQKQALL